jgi:TrmH family RNA methyltransferase
MRRARNALQRREFTIRSQSARTADIHRGSLTDANRFASLVAMRPVQRTTRLRAGESDTAASAEIISSRDNRWLKRFRAALHGAESDEDSAIGAEGPHLVEAALGSGARVEAVLISASGERHLARLRNKISAETAMLRTTDRLFAGVAATEAPQGIAALVHPHEASFDEITRGTPLLVILAGVQDPGNVGTILRTAEAMGATAVATCSVAGLGTSNPRAPKALRASAGSALRLPLARCASAATLLVQLRVAGIKSIAACPASSDAVATESAASPAPPPWEIDWKGPVALWIGNEGAGLPGEIARSADARVTIPHAASEAGAVESLNAAAAATILLYEAAKQRGTLS